jgi:glyoxylase-like metal-dependent hydrolase (beta-lactamase superfamily II)
VLEQVCDKIYRSEIPLPHNPLKALNSYIIKGKEKSIIVDTGFNLKESKEVFYKNLDDLAVDISKAEVIVTHLHADHSGLAHELYQKGAKIFMSEGDGNVAAKLKVLGNWTKTSDRLRMFGLEMGEELLHIHPGMAYAPGGEFEFNVLREGDQIGVDEYRFEVVSVPGHTPDMINLYEPRYEIYLSGDHVLDPITPNIAFWGFEHPGILNQYFNSLKKIYDFKIKLMLPAHRMLITDHQKRINELLEHHAHRLKEIEAILTRKEKETTVEGVASEMSWKIRAKDWTDFPPAQKIFAVGEAMSHLEYLVNQNRVTMREDNGILYFKH